MNDVLFKRKIYETLVEWKKQAADSRALLIEGARRVSKSTIAEEYVIHTKKLMRAENRLYLPAYMTFCL